MDTEDDEEESTTQSAGGEPSQKGHFYGGSGGEISQKGNFQIVFSLFIAVLRRKFSKISNF